MCQQRHLSSVLDTTTSPAPTSPFPEDSTTFLTEQNYFDDFDWTEWITNFFDNLMRRLAEVHDNTDFSAEACAASGSSGQCLYTQLVYMFIDGNETCSIYTIGSCDENIKG